MSTQSSASKVLTAVFFLALVTAVGAGLFFVFMDTTPPDIRLKPDSGFISSNTKFLLTVSDSGAGIKSVEIVSVQAGKQTQVERKDLIPPSPTMETEFKIPAEAAREGELEIRITARDASYFFLGSAGTAVLSKTFKVDVTPPRIDLLTVQNYINQGGAALAVYTVSEETSSTGVKVDAYVFPGYKLSGNTYGCFFAMPYELAPNQFKPQVFAADLAGNEKTRAYPFMLKPKKFPLDRINLSESFLEDKMAQFQSYYPDAKRPIDIFMQVNSDMRRKNRLVLQQVGLDTAPKILWSEPFLRLPNAAPRAGFGDQRDYYYQDKKIDHQVHLGVDLASLQNAPVPAANNGVVVQTGFMGIYGQAVIIDHGMGLQSLYSHLSQIDVKKGDSVIRGQFIGKTGATGLAAGDHLHFGIVVSGIEVSPVEWWDEHWIKDNVFGKLPK